MNNNKTTLLVLYATWGLYFLILWPKMLYFNENGDLTAGYRNVWGDWAMHISQAHAFAYQPILEVLNNHPLYTGIPLTYPFVVNLISGLLLRGGIDLVGAFVLPSLFITLLLLLNLYIFGKVFTRSSTQTLIAISLFLCSGGLGFYQFILDMHSDFSWERFAHPPHEYTHMKEAGFWWTTTLWAHLVPQRAFLLGMAVALLLLTYLYYHLSHEFKKIKPKSMIGLGVLTGVLAWIHTHSLIMLFLLTVWLGVTNLKYLRHWLAFGLRTAITALPFFLVFSGGEGFEHIKWLPGWLANKSELNVSIWMFWLKNWGLMLPLFVLGFGKLLSRKYKHEPEHPINFQFSIFNFQTLKQFGDPQIKFISGFVWIFIMANLIQFQPYNWDNHKLLLWTYWIFSLVVASLLASIWARNMLGKIVAIVLFMILIASGLIDNWRVLSTSKESFVMISKQDIELAEFLRNHSNSQDLVLTSDDHLHWVPLMAGRDIVLGYRGWMWSHGLDYGSREMDIRTIYQGRPDARALIDTYGIDFVVTDGKTRQDWQSNEAFFKENYDLLITSPRFNVYKIKQRK